MYNPFEYAPYAKDVPTRICPYCQYDATAVSNFSFSIHLRRCHIAGIKSKKQKILQGMQEKLFADAKTKFSKKNLNLNTKHSIEIKMTSQIVDRAFDQFRGLSSPTTEEFVKLCDTAKDFKFYQCCDALSDSLNKFPLEELPKLVDFLQQPPSVYESTECDNYTIYEIVKKKLSTFSDDQLKVLYPYLSCCDFGWDEFVAKHK